MTHLEASDRTAPTPAGTFAADYEAVTHAAGVRILDERRIVRVVGDDRATFFHGMTSADVKSAKPGDVLPALILTEHAHVIADLFIWVAADALLLDIDSDAWERARAHLERLLVADDVEFEDESGLRVVDVEGPRAIEAARLVGGAAASSLGEWRFVSIGELFVANLPRVGGPAISILAPKVRVEADVAKILAAVHNSRLVSADAIEAIRIEHGVARIGVDTLDKTLALEARLDRAISLGKGCYVGQETIERATARGALKKRLLGLKFADARGATVGAAVILAGKEVGRVTSVVQAPRLGAIGLALLHHSSWAAGTEVSVESGGGTGRAIVSELPFAQD
ncbi:MAG TPA: glycine cleavage T C-terminal barrel domain-containing protein [Candidatus Acidoferrales bacterium]|nr:glycine cleavage T C-terminal barrel domain-containing protein [Candidatus Acidoferrales bacterium]